MTRSVMLRVVRRKPRSLRSPFLPLVTAAVSGRLLLSTLPSTQFGATAHYQTAILARRIVAPQNASIFVSWNGTMPERAAALHHQRDLAEVLVRLHVRLRRKGIVQLEGAIDRQRELAGNDRVPQIGAHQPHHLAQF